MGLIRRKRRTKWGGAGGSIELPVSTATRAQSRDEAAFFFVTPCYRKKEEAFQLSNHSGVSSETSQSLNRQSQDKIQKCERTLTKKNRIRKRQAQYQTNMDPTSKRHQLAQAVVEHCELTLNTTNERWKHWVVCGLRELKRCSSDGQAQNGPTDLLPHSNNVEFKDAG